MFSLEKLKSSLEGEFVFPKNDVRIELQKHEVKTESKFLSETLSPRLSPRTTSPHKLSGSASARGMAQPVITEPYIRFGTKFYTQDWLAIEYYGHAPLQATPSQREKKSRKPVASLTTSAETEDEEFVCDLQKADERASELFAFDSHIPSSNSLRSVCDVKRSNLYRLLFYPTPILVPDFNKVYKQIALPDPGNDELHISFGPISLSVGELVQPFFCSVALYDVATRKRMTEDFVFSNAAELVSKKETSVPRLNLDLRIATAVFQLPPLAKRENLFVVVMLYKTLYRGAPDEFLDFISKEKKEKERKKFQDEIKEAIPRLAEYRQNIAWSAHPLAKEKKAKVPLRFARMNKNYDVYSYLEELKQSKADKTKDKTKGDFGGCDLDLTVVPYEELMQAPSKVPRIDPNYCRFIKNADKDFGTPFELEVLSFDSPQKIYQEYFSNLFVFPNLGSFSRTRFKSIAVTVKILGNDNAVDVPGIELIYDDHPSKPFLKEKSFAVAYDEKKPRFLDGVKMRLPIELNQKSHLFFTYYSVECKEPKKGESSKSVIGYSFLPFFDNDRRIINTSATFELPIAKELAPGYLTADPDDIAWMEAKKVTLSFDLFLNSSIYPRDPVLHSFLCSKWDHSELQKISDPHDLIRFLPHVIHVLSKACANNEKAEQMSKVAFEGLLWTFHTVEKNSPKSKILDDFIQTMFHIDECQDLWYHVCRNWRVYINEKDGDTESVNSLHYSRFLMAFILRAMTLSLHAQGALEDENRSKRLSSQQSNELSNLIVTLATSVKNYYNVVTLDSQIALILNTNLAHWMADLATLLDLDLYFSILRKVMQVYQSDRYGLESVLALILPFMRILAQSPHYNSLNFPCHAPDLGVALSGKDLLDHWKSQHYLAGVLCESAHNAFRSKEKHLIMMVANTLATLFYWNDHNPRFQSASARSKIASLYFPIVMSASDVFVDNLKKLKLDMNESKILYSVLLYIMKDAEPKYYELWWQKEREVKVCNFFTMLKFCITTFKYHGDTKARTMRNDHFHGIVKEALALPTLYPTHAMAKGFMKEDDSHPNLAEGDEEKKKTKEVHKDKDKAEDSAVSTKKEKKTAKKGLPAGERVHYMPFEVKRHLDDYERYLALTPKDALHSDTEALKEKHLVNEVAHIVMDVTATFVHAFKALLRLESRISLFEEVFSVFPALLKEKQSTSVLRRVFFTLYRVLPEFEETLFIFKNAVFGDIIHAILSHCNSKSKQTRDQAISLYIFLIERNNSIVNNIARIKLQTTIAITKIVGHDDADDYSASAYYKERSNELLVKTFGVALKKFMASPLKKQIIDLDKKINNVIEGDKKMTQYAHDPEMMAQLQYDISCQLQESPDERIAWLENLASFHSQNKNVEEVAIVKVLTAALIQEYLTLIWRWSTKLPAAFQLVAPDVQTMLAIPSKESLLVLEDEICQSKLFNHEGFIQLLKEAIEVLKKGGFYESAVAAYQMLLPIFQESCDYRKQMQCHQDLVALTETLIDESQMKQRIFSNYYRVAFYGKKFEDMDKQAYIYKEPVTCMLPVFTAKLIDQFSVKFGKENVVQLKNIIPKDHVFEPEKVYLQIGSVLPHFTEKELETERNTEWSKVFNVGAFHMDQPFTKDGKGAQAVSHEDQWIRRTIYKTEFAFPFVLKRVLIVRTSDQELSPIENAINSISDKLATFNAELNSQRPRLKILQRDLQGTLLHQVNAGPMALVQSFLSEEAKSKYPEDLRNLLADRFNSFVRILHHAVVLNGTLKGSDATQQVLQETLEQQLKAMTDKQKEYPIFATRRLLLAKEKQREDILASQQISRTLQFDVNEGVEIRQRRESMKRQGPESPAKAVSTRPNLLAQDDSALNGDRSLGRTKSRENRRSVVTPKTMGGEDFKDKSKDKEDRKLGKESVQSVDKLRRPRGSSKRPDEKDGSELSSSSPRTSSPLNTPKASTSAKDSPQQHSPTVTPSKVNSNTLTHAHAQAKDEPDERVVTIRVAVKKMSEELKLQVKGLIAVDQNNDVNALFPLLKLLKSVTTEIKRLNDLFPLKDYSFQAPSTLSQNRVLLVKYLIDKEGEMIHNLLSEVEDKIDTNSDPATFKSTIQILRDVIALIGQAK